MRRPLPDSPAYVSGLRATLDAAGFGATRIVIPDGGYDPAIIADAAANATFNASFDVVGLHYPCTSVHPEVAAGGKAFWAVRVEGGDTQRGSSQSAAAYTFSHA